MSMTSQQAQDEIFARVRALAQQAPTVEVVWPSTIVLAPKADNVAWSRVTLVHTGGGQASLGCANGRRRWGRSGVLTVQVFWPIRDDGANKSFAVACRFRNGFESFATPGGAWFREATATQVGNDKAWHQSNFVTNFLYEEIR